MVVVGEGDIWITGRVADLITGAEFGVISALKCLARGEGLFTSADSIMTGQEFVGTGFGRV